MPAKTKRSIRKVSQAVTKELWCIQPDKLEQIVEFLELRASGHQFTEDEINDRVQGGDHGDRSMFIEGGIQVIDVFGTLAPRMNVMTRISGGTSLPSISSAVNAAAASDKVKTIILRVESPGGTYIGTPEVREAILDAKKAGKRVVTSASNEFASGAYWIGSSAHEVYASTSTSTGSIGVYSVARNDKVAAEKDGTKFHLFKAGKLKASLHPMTEWTKEEISAQQDRIDGIFDQFIEAVSENRGVSKDEVKERFGSGTTVFGEEAKARGMIDGVATFDEVLARERDRLSSSSSSISLVSEKDDDMKITPRVKAALFARELVADLEASDEVCVAALNAFSAGIGESIADDASEADILTVLRKEPSKDLALASAGTTVMGNETADSTNDDSTVSFDPSRLRAMAASFPHVSSEMALDAIEQVSDGEATMDDVIDRWTENASNEEGDVVITGGEAQIDKFSRGAIASMISSAGEKFEHLVESEDEALGRSMANHDTSRIAEKWMIQTGQITAREADSMSREEIAEEFIAVGGSRKHRLPDLVSGGTVNYSGDHPHLVDQLANKVLWNPYPIASYKYKQWTAKLPDVKDFKPRHFVEVGIFDSMDVFTEEDTETNELKLKSGKKAWYDADRYRNKVGLTVEMVVDDEVDGFMRMLQSMAALPNRTINRMSLDLLNHNPNLWDGTPLFHADHSNLVTGGGAPSSAQANKMIKLHQLQTGYDGEEMDEPPTRSLHPVNHREAAMQTFQRAKYDSKVANTDSEINTVRDEIDPIIDARLDKFDDTAWYTMVTPALSPVIGHCFMKGYGSGGKREVRYDHESTNRYYYLEARFGVACVDYRGMVKNPGA